MVSSSIGWKELPYASAPMRLDGTNLRVDRLDWNQPNWVSNTYLVSGVATEDEMMRGEETEALGLMNQLPSMPESATLLLPGTHSKHLRIENGAVVEIKTYMTGELYEVLSRHSILRSSVASVEPSSKTGFKEGINYARQRGLGAALFQTRARHVLHKRPASENATFLSGVLIGAELNDLRDAGQSNIFLGGAVRLRDLYSRALQQLGMKDFHPFSDDELNRAVPFAHGILLSRPNT
jgi:2-dehydro-3-deoxygalactonokinase